MARLITVVCDWCGFKGTDNSPHAFFGFSFLMDNNILDQAEICEECRRRVLELKDVIKAGGSPL